MKSYKPGDTITLEVELSDVSGVADVIACFRGVKQGRQIGLRGNGNGQLSSKVVLTRKVDAATRPDEYFLQMLAVFDTVGNQQEHLRDDIRFVIERTSEDKDPPQLLNVTLT